MKNPRKWIAFLLLLLLLLCGCSTKTPAASSSPVSSEPQKPTGPYPRTDGVTLEALICAEPALKKAGLTFAESPVWQAWQEKTGVSLHFTVVSDTTALTMALSTGTFPDIFWMDHTAFHGGLDRMAAEGMAIDCSPYAAEMPDYLRVLQSDTQYRKFVSGSDGGIYTFGHFAEADSPLLCSAGMVVRKDALEALDAKIPQTYAEFTDLLKALHDQLQYTVPLAADNWERMLTDGFLTSCFGLPCAGLYQTDGVCAFGAAEESYREALLGLKNWRDKGYLPAELNTAQTSAVQRLLEKRCAVSYLTEAELQEVLSAAGSSKKPFELVGIPSLGADGERGQFCAKRSVTLSKWNGFISADCKHPEAAVAFFNWLYTPEGALLANYGADENGSALSAYNDAVLQNENGLSVSEAASVYTLIGRNMVETVSGIRQRLSHPEQTEIQAAWANTEVNAHTVSGLGKEQAAWAELHALVTAWSYDFVVGNQPIQKAFADYTASLEEAGLTDLLAEAQASYDAWLAR